LGLANPENHARPSSFPPAKAVGGIKNCTENSTCLPDGPVVGLEKMEDKHKMECAYDLEKKYLTQQEVADLFRVRPATVKNWRDAGHMDYFQPPGSTRVLYPKESIDTFERQNTRKAKIIEFRKPAEVKRKMPGMSSKSKKEWRV